MICPSGRRREAKKELEGVKLALSSVINAVNIDLESSRKLKSFLQQQQGSADTDDLSLHNALAQPQAKMVAYESKSGGIIQTVKDMQAKAEEELSALRKKEMGDAHEFKVLEQGLNGEIEHGKEKLSAATKTKAAAEEYSANLKTECETTAAEWAERQKSAKEEMAAIEKAKEILVSGVTALSQVSVSHKSIEFDQDEDENTQKRRKLVQKFES